MYNCKMCGETSKPGQQRLVHLLKKKTGEIKSELPVCPGCKQLLDSGFEFQPFNASKPSPSFLRNLKPEQVGDDLPLS